MQILRSDPPARQPLVDVSTVPNQYEEAMKKSAAIMDPLITEMQDDIAKLPPYVLNWEGSRYVVRLAEVEYMEALASYEYGQAPMMRLANAHLGLWQSWLDAVELYELVHRGKP